MSNLHFSEKLFAMAPCRAKEGNCPFTQHGDGNIAQLASDFRKLHENGEAVPGVSSNSGEIKQFQFMDDGSFKLGKRHYTKDGDLIPTASTIRSRRRKERMANQEAASEPEAPMATELSYDERIAAQVDQYMEDHPHKPMGEAQATNAVKALAKRYGDEDFEKWADRDNTREIAALQLAAELWESDWFRATQILRVSGLLETHQSGYGHTPDTVRLRRGGSPGWTDGYIRVDAKNIKNSLLWHRRADRTTLMAAIGMDTDDDPNAIHTLLASALKERLDHEEKQKVEDKEAARLAAPVNWPKMTKAQFFRDMGDKFDPANRHHLEIEQVLVAMGKDRTALWLEKPGFRYKKSYLDFIARQIIREGNRKES